MQVVAISDTHGDHEKLKVPSGDVLVVAGDICAVTDIRDVYNFAKWIDSLPHHYKLLVAGNHDTPLQNQTHLCIPILTAAGVTYLEDTLIEIMGVRFYGSPWVPKVDSNRTWAFHKYRMSEDLRKMWARIPPDIDVLITHSPAFGYGDACPRRQILLRDAAPEDREKMWASPTVEHIGCELLADRILEIKPQYHLFGHVHEQSGYISWEDGICRMNVSHLGREHSNSLQPQVFTVEGKARGRREEGQEGQGKEEGCQADRPEASDLSSKELAS